MNNHIRTALFLGSLALSIPALGQEPAGASSKDSVEGSEVRQLSQRVDSLEASIEALKIQMVESNPVTSGKYLKWGRGWTFSVSQSMQRFKTEAGYTFLTARSNRLCIQVGVEQEAGLVKESELSHQSVDGKISLGSPVLLNFVSVNGYFRTMYFTHDDYNHPEATSGGLGAGAELEFWFKPTLCYTIGGSYTTTVSQNSSMPVRLTEVSFIGFKYFLDFSKDR